MSRFFRLKMQKFLVTMSCTETGNFILQIANLKIFFCCTTLNHEGGFKFRIIDFGRKEKDGQWYRILLNNDQYIYEGKSGVIKACTKFWIFIPDDSEVFRHY